MNTKRAYKLQEFVAHSAAVNCLKIGRKSSKVLVTGGEDHKVNLWAIGKPNAILSLYGHSSGVDSVTFDASEGLLAAGAASGTTKLWDLEEAKDTNLKIWDIRKKGCIHTYKGHTRGVNVLRFTQDGRWTVSGGKDYVVKDFIKNLLSSASEKSMASDSIQVPDEEFRSKLGNIIQRVQYLPGIQNVTRLSKEFTELSAFHQPKDFFFVQIMLVKNSQSAIFEPIFHDSYFDFLEKVNSPSLYTETVKTTCLICKAILEPEIQLHPMVNQQVLSHVTKNLGKWLGKLIVRTDCWSLLKTDLALEPFIAYERGLMSKSIPFVIEVLESCRRSPLCPSFETILSLLSEIYMMPNLQDGLLFSIEGLLEKFNVLEPLKPASTLQEKHRQMNLNVDFEERKIIVKPLKFGKYDDRAPRDSHLIASRIQFSTEEFLVTIKKPDSFFGIYPGLVRKMEDAVLEVVEKAGPLLIKLAATVGCEAAEAGAIIADQHRRMDGSVTRISFLMGGNAGSVPVSVRLAEKYIRQMSKKFLGGWMSYLVRDLLQQQGVPHALQPAIVESVIDDNLEGIHKKLGACAKTEAHGYSRRQPVIWTPTENQIFVKEIGNALEKDFDVDAMSNLLKSWRESKDKLAALCTVICNQFIFQKDPPSVFMYTKKMAYLDPLVKGRNGGMLDLLHALEKFLKTHPQPRGLEDLLLDGFITTGYLSEKAILEWYEEGSKRDGNNARLFESVRHLVPEEPDYDIWAEESDFDFVAEEPNFVDMI
ncbi:uncharacterized protein LOC9307403 isoform X2 [Arabidopsis lyrata subsp. lyrata]|uniref:uncharacterized protein LOC9307403 isoform X2 n=1 Tax=Arabidopsis lyrata subsp. lyrata TaxID=81972 RepID=UPI000A29D5A4|nr:uncharacterized protein LOC9307403 isoform X2 [Arabidopsis lyrata subsp. lyrata]|eukprot:XP_020878152.1 uncharacterized protein LOC9307403 isoform X2 [Arabidopsis lyrata subsp. lyrata]